jgi:hypothetical protein
MDKLTKYKIEIIKKIINSQDIVDLILNELNSEVPNTDIINTNVFEYDYVPEIDSEAKTYVCIDGDLDATGTTTYNDITMYIYVFTHKTLMNLQDESGTRIDVLCNKIDNLLNSQMGFGMGKIIFDSCRRFVPQTDHYGRAILYRIKDLNSNGINNE